MTKNPIAKNMKINKPKVIPDKREAEKVQQQIRELAEARKIEYADQDMVTLHAPVIRKFMDKVMGEGSYDSCLITDESMMIDFFGYDDEGKEELRELITKAYGDRHVDLDDYIWEMALKLEKNNE